MWVLKEGGGAVNLALCLKLTVDGVPEDSQVFAWPNKISSPVVTVHRGSRDSCDSFVEEVATRMNAGWVGR